MNDSTELKAQVKQMLVENLMLKISAAEIGRRPAAVRAGQPWIGLSGRAATGSGT
jgi:hypothetical protein